MSLELTQTAFRGRNDDGSESGASWKDAINANWSQLCDVNFRVRFRIDSTSITPPTGGSDSMRIQFNLNGGGWVLVGNVSEEGTFVLYHSTTGYVDGADCTDQLGSGSTFISNNNGCDDTDGQTGTCVYDGAPSTANLTAEVEFCLQLVSADLVNGDTIQLRCIKGSGGTLDNYLQTPSITVSIPPDPATEGTQYQEPLDPVAIPTPIGYDG